MNQVDYGYLFHNGKSKVWIVTSKKEKNSGNDLNGYSTKNEVIIFFENGEVISTKFNKLFDSKGRKGTYSIDSEKKEINLTFSKKKWYFRFEPTGRHKINLIPIGKSKAQARFTIESLRPDLKSFESSKSE